MNYDQILKHLQNTNDIESLQKYLNSIEKQNLKIVTDNLSVHFADIIQNTKNIDSLYLKYLEEYILLILKHKEATFPFYFNILESIKNSEKEDYETHLIFFVHSLFDYEYLGKYKARFFINLMKENLSVEQYSICKKIMLDLHFDEIKDLCSFNNVLKNYFYDNKSFSFNYLIQDFIYKLSNCYWKKDSLAHFLNFLNKDLKGRTFYFDNKKYTFKSIVTVPLKNKNIAKISVKESYSVFSLNDIIWNDFINE